MVLYNRHQRDLRKFLSYYRGVLVNNDGRGTQYLPTMSRAVTTFTTGARGTLGGSWEIKAGLVFRAPVQSNQRKVPGTLIIFKVTLVPRQLWNNVPVRWFDLHILTSSVLLLKLFQTTSL